MKAYKIIAVGAALLLACSCGYNEKGTAEGNTAVIIEIQEIPEDTGVTEAAKEKKPFVSGTGLLDCNYFDDGYFISWDNRSEEYPSDKKIISGVVPHHLTAGHLISGFFKAAAKSRSDIETVVIIATSHIEGNESFYTTYSDWNSPFGIVETDRDIVSLFCNESGAAVDNERLIADHSASSHIPFVKHYFPEAKTACLLVAPGFDKSLPERLADVLYSIPDKEKCLFLFSVDFSHYLSAVEADRADEITIKAVSERDYGKIEGFTNDNVDSPFCLSAYLRLSELFGNEVYEADNCNTADVLGIPYSKELYPEGVTSYFVFMTRSDNGG